VKKALDNAVEMGAETVQLFAQSPRTWRFPEHDRADLEAFRSKREAAGLPAFVHALYLVNLAAPDDAIYSKSVDTMRSTVDAACAIEAEGLPSRRRLRDGPRASCARAATGARPV
jgi:deoxyribonuclease-4